MRDVSIRGICASQSGWPQRDTVRMSGDGQNVRHPVLSHEDRASAQQLHKVILAANRKVQLEAR